MERYVVVTVTHEQRGAIRATDMLESAGIPVMVQHVFEQASVTQKSAYRLMVPDSLCMPASQIIEPVLNQS